MTRNVAVSLACGIVLLCLCGSGLAQDFDPHTDLSLFRPAVRTLIERADELVSMGSYHEALTVLSEAASVESERERLHDIRIRQALVNLYLGRVGYARLTLSRIIRSQNYVPALIAAAQAYVYHHPYDIVRGRTVLTQALSQEPENWLALVEMGYVDFHMENLSEAQSRFEAALRVNREAIRAYFGLADVAFKRGEYSKAIRHLQQALQMQPENPDIMLKIGDTYLGSNLLRRTASATAWYDRALEYGARHPRAYAAVILSLMMPLTAQNAQPYIEELRRVAPDSSYLTWIDGMALELTGRVGGAIEKFRQAIEQDARNWYARFSLANALSGRGNREYVHWVGSSVYRYQPHIHQRQAMDQYQAIMQNAPTFPFIKHAQQWYRFLQDTPDSSFVSSAMQEELQKLQRVGSLLRKGLY